MHLGPPLGEGHINTSTRAGTSECKCQTSRKMEETKGENQAFPGKGLRPGHHSRSGSHPAAGHSEICPHWLHTTRSCLCSAAASLEGDTTGNPEYFRENTSLQRSWLGNSLAVLRPRCRSTVSLQRNLFPEKILWSFEN